MWSQEIDKKSEVRNRVKKWSKKVEGKKWVNVERERNEKGREKVGEKVERNDLSKKVEREWSEKVKRVKHGLRNG